MLTQRAGFILLSHHTATPGRTLVVRPRLSTEGAFERAALRKRAYDAERGAVRGRGQAARVAVRQRAHAPAARPPARRELRQDRRGAKIAHRLNAQGAHQSIVLLN